MDNGGAGAGGNGKEKYLPAYPLTRITPLIGITPLMGTTPTSPIRLWHDEAGAGAVSTDIEQDEVVERTRDYS